MPCGLTRQWCATCQEDTIHRGGNAVEAGNTCVHCGTKRPVREEVRILTYNPRNPIAKAEALKEIRSRAKELKARAKARSGRTKS